MVVVVVITTMNISTGVRNMAAWSIVGKANQRAGVRMRALTSTQAQNNHSTAQRARTR